MTATCPMDGCDYTGPARSVEAHISGSSDEAHSGRLGRNWRSTIEGSHEEARPAVEPDEQAEVATEEASEAPTAESSNDDLGLPPGWTVVAATVVFLLLVVVASTDPAAGPVEEETDAESEDASSEEMEATWDA